MEATILNHPLINHKLSILRDKKTGTKEFREIVGEISQILCYECMKDAELTEKDIETPICETKGYFIDEDKYAISYELPMRNVRWSIVSNAKC